MRVQAVESIQFVSKVDIKNRITKKNITPRDIQTTTAAVAMGGGTQSTKNVTSFDNLHTITDN